MEARNKNLCVPTSAFKDTYLFVTEKIFIYFCFRKRFQVVSRQRNMGNCQLQPMPGYQEDIARSVRTRDRNYNHDIFHWIHIVVDSTHHGCVDICLLQVSNYSKERINCIYFYYVTNCIVKYRTWHSWAGGLQFESQL